MNDYCTVNILDMIEAIGEDALVGILSDFSCPLNPEIETFVKKNAIDFAKKKISITYLVLDNAGDILSIFALTHKALYLAEATASRAKCEDIPSVSPREWAQTAAIGIALRNAGFGLQFAMAGESFSANAPDEFALDVGSGATSFGNESGVENTSANTSETGTPALSVAVPPKELTSEEKFQLACKVHCTLKKYQGRTLGDVLQLDPSFINYLATKYEGDEKMKEAAKVICEYAATQAA